MDYTALYTTGYHGTTAGDREYVFDRHQERQVYSALWLRNVLVQGFNQLLNSGGTHFVVVFAVQGHQSRTNDDRSVVTRELVLIQKFANFHLYQLEQLFVVYHVRFVQEHNDVRYTYLTGEQDVLTSLRHGAVSCGTYQDSAVHLSSTGDHVLNVVGVSRAVYVRVVASRGLVLNVRGSDGDTALTLFRCIVDTVESYSVTAPYFRTYAGQSSGQGGFTVVNVTDGAHVHVGLGTFKLFFCHLRCPLAKSLPKKPQPFTEALLSRS
ncbi:hypothetical protein Misp06_04442 [Microbulbifer sp. NBRC 101763]